MSLSEWRLAKDNARRIEQARPAYERWIRQMWRRWRSPLLALGRGDTVRFVIGEPFVMSGRLWLCTDVGTPPVCALRLRDVYPIPARFDPEHYGEDVFSRVELDACRRLSRQQRKRVAMLFRW